MQITAAVSRIFPLILLSNYARPPNPQRYNPPTARSQFSAYRRCPFYIAFPIIGFQIFMQYGMYIGFRTLPSPRLEQHWIFIVFPMFGHSLPLQGSREIGFSLFSRYLAILLLQDWGNGAFSLYHNIPLCNILSEA